MFAAFLITQTCISLLKFSQNMALSNTSRQLDGVGALLFNMRIDLTCTRAQFLISTLVGFLIGSTLHKRHF